MSEEARNKKVVTAFFALFSRGETDQAFQLVAQDVSWWVPGNLPFSGTKTKAQYLQVVSAIRGGFPAGVTFSVHSLLAEGDRVSAEVESRGEHVNGRTYNNHYHFLFVLRAGQFIDVKEYMDTQHLAQLIAP